MRRRAADTIAANFYGGGSISSPATMRNSLLLTLVSVAASIAASTDTALSQQPPATPRKATVCEMSKKPDGWNHVRVRLTAVATQDFEDFSLTDPACGDTALIWLTYGGSVSSGTIYCCPGEGGESRRPKPLVIDGVALPLVEDSVFDRFRALLGKQARTAARVTVVGTFFAGEKGDLGRGFGHMGCCSLLVIERVESFKEVRSPGR